MATQDEIDQQRRIVTQTRGDVLNLLDLAASIRARLNSYTRLNMKGADPGAFEGTGATQESYDAAIVALQQIAALPEDVFVALEKFAR